MPWDEESRGKRTKATPSTRKGGLFVSKTCSSPLHASWDSSVEHRTKLLPIKNKNPPIQSPFGATCSSFSRVSFTLLAFTFCSFSHTSGDFGQELENCKSWRPPLKRQHLPMIGRINFKRPPIRECTWRWNGLGWWHFENEGIWWMVGRACLGWGNMDGQHNTS